MKSVTVCWFEIPVQNMDRAILFYEKVFDCKLSRQIMGDFEMAWFPWDERNGGAGGSLVYQKDFYKPSLDSGPLIYFTSEDCTTELERVKECGGKVLFERRLIAPNIGFMGVFVDSEGNRIALHSTK